MVYNEKKGKIGLGAREPMEPAKWVAEIEKMEV